MRIKIRCIICRKIESGNGNDAYPIIEGICCEECNKRLVLPLKNRLSNIFNEKKDIPKTYRIK